MLTRLITTVAVGLATAGAVAQVDRPTIPPPTIETIVPQRPIITNNGVITIGGVEATISIRGNVAITELAVTLRNAGSRMGEAQLLLPVPQGAAIKRFGLDGLNEGTAELLPVDQAREIYRAIVRKMIDPGLLEFAGTALIRSSVFPVPPQGEQVFRVAYEELLTVHNGRVDYMLPKTQALGAAGGWTINATVEAAGSGELGPVFSPSHGLTTEMPGASRATIAVQNASAPGAFRLSAVVDRSAAGSMTTMLYPDARVGPDGGGYFMAVLRAPEHGDGAVSIKRELTIVIDRSGSMANGKIEQAIASARQVLAGLLPGEKFNIIDYAEEVRSFRAAPVVKTDETLAEALRYVDGLVARGGTNLHDALIESIGQKTEEGFLPVVLFMTDGLATQGITGEVEIREAAAKANTGSRRVFTFGVGYDVNTALLSSLSDESRAAATFLRPEDDVEVKVGEVFDRLDGAVVTEPVFGSILVSDLQNEGRRRSATQMILPGNLPDLFKGDQLVVIGQYLGNAPISLSIDGTTATGDAWTTTAIADPGDATVQNGFVARLWAQRRIATLTAQIRKAGAAGTEPSEELVDEITRLSLEHGILTEYTAFLAAEETELNLAAGGEVLGQARENFRRRAVETRAGRGAQYQDRQLKVARDAGAAAPASSPTLRAESLSLEAVADMEDDRDAYGKYFEDLVRVQQVADRTLLRREGRWLDARLGETEDAEPDRVVEFDSDGYWTLVEELVAEGRQALLAQGLDIEFLHNGERVLVKLADASVSADDNEGDD